MTLAVWNPLDERHTVRKRYYKGRKEGKPYVTNWSCKTGIRNGEASLERIAALVDGIRERDNTLCQGDYILPGVGRHKEARHR